VPLIGVVFIAALAVTTIAVSPGQESPPSRTVALTFDDLPATAGRVAPLTSLRTMTDRLLATLVREGVPAIGFVNEIGLAVPGEVEARTALLEAWLDAGFELGNHTYSHVSIDRVPFDVYRQDVIRGEVITRRLLEERGQRLRYFRHPQLQTGPTPEYKAALDGLLAERGYRVAPVTIDHNDFIFADVYRRAMVRGDLATAERVRDAYVPYLEAVTAHFEALSRQSLGYEIPQIFLLHANELNADSLVDVIAMLRRRGYRFTTLDTALQDPAYALPAAPSVGGLSWLHRWMLARGLPVQQEPREPVFVRELFRAR
jgi:peptidoglycan/xylan/chitin deacetylase (PgdA/CDA1 family)